MAPLLYKQGDTQGAKDLLVQASKIDKEKSTLEKAASEYTYEKAHENDRRDYLNGIANAIQNTAMAIAPTSAVRIV